LLAGVELQPVITLPTIDRSKTTEERIHGEICQICGLCYFAILRVMISRGYKCYRATAQLSQARPRCFSIT